MVIYNCGNEAKVGDKVLRFDSNTGTLAVGEYVVTGVKSGKTIVIDIDNVLRPFSTEYFTLISRKGETTMKTKQFTKADLKTGMRVTFRDGDVGVCFESSPSQSSLHVVNFNNTWCGLSTHEDDLTYEDDHDLDVVKVTSVRVYDILNRTAQETIIWEREAIKSKEQIAYDEAVEATKAARQAYELAQKKLEALNPANK